MDEKSYRHWIKFNSLRCIERIDGCWTHYIEIVFLISQVFVFFPTMKRIFFSHVQHGNGLVVFGHSFLCVAFQSFFDMIIRWFTESTDALWHTTTIVARMNYQTTSCHACYVSWIVFKEDLRILIYPEFKRNYHLFGIQNK